MNILTVSSITGGLSHLIPLYVLHQRYLKINTKIKNQFLVKSELQPLLMTQGIECLPIDYNLKGDLIMTNNLLSIKERIVEMEKEAFAIVKPSLIIEDNAFSTPLIAEKNQVPRISIQRTGFFRSIDKRYRNDKHIHSLEKGGSLGESLNFYDLKESIHENYGRHFLKHYLNSKAKIIPGIPTIERLPVDIENEDSYFHCGPLIVMDKPSFNLLNRLNEFVRANSQKKIVFITTGLIDTTPVEEFIQFFIKRNYAVVTTCSCNTDITDAYEQEFFYNRSLPLNYICSISDLVIHQCGSGMYHYPIINRVPSLTLGTQCYDREDIALRLQELGASRHIPHPHDNPNYWNIFLELVKRFEMNELVDYNMIERLRIEINNTMLNFEMEKVIQYALA